LGADLWVGAALANRPCWSSSSCHLSLSLSLSLSDSVLTVHPPSEKGKLEQISKEYANPTKTPDLNFPLSGTHQSKRTINEEQKIGNPETFHYSESFFTYLTQQLQKTTDILREGQTNPHV